MHSRTIGPMQSESEFFTSVCTVVPTLLVAAAVGSLALKDGFDVLDNVSLRSLLWNKETEACKPRTDCRKAVARLLALFVFFLTAGIAIGASFWGLAYSLGKGSCMRLAAASAALFFLLFALYTGAALLKTMVTSSNSSEGSDIVQCQSLAPNPSRAAAEESP